MSILRWLCCLGLIGSAITVTGCAVGYNGSLAMSSDQATQLRRYRAWREQQAREMNQSAGQTASAPAASGSSGAPSAAGSTASASSSRQVRFRGDSTASTPSAAPSSPRGATIANVGQTARAPGLRPLGMYGVLQSRSPARDPDAVPGGPTNSHQVTFATEGSDFDPAISPDGEYLAFASTVHREQADLYLKRVDGSTITQLTSDNANNVMPTFSPDGRRIAFTSDRNGNWDLFLMDRDGSQPIQLTHDTVDEIHPSFSPDGRRLVYSAYSQQSGQWELVVLDVDRPAVRRFIGHGLFPQWSPAGDRILFQKARERGTRWFSIWTIDLVDGEATRPTEIVAATNAAAITPAWSPDGSHIVFCTVVQPDLQASDYPDQADIWVMDIHGRSRANLTGNGFVNTQPIWGADGAIYYVTTRADTGGENIWAMRADRTINVVQSMASGAEERASDQASAGASDPSGAAAPTATTLPEAEARPDGTHGPHLTAGAPTPTPALTSPARQPATASRANRATVIPTAPVPAPMDPQVGDALQPQETMASEPTFDLSQGMEEALAAPDEAQRNAMVPIPGE